ncbi:Uma2 family endonuclease [Fulvimarina sp. 2208YS6-2-32]|uniref:Uma2 family endonuclease n=1 Tax=Fulvimarina uroteuthidis TaxID=3098149 RepID=A0ABU5I1F8_9HYPH|nr:Uma2 family endonuclease [Fulvimarina sp. 2208YS6-2-32]MDY8108593.1 Uma2 family endonuclease [Fulvimarina sp. 2208YS6-2-32]
MSAVEELERQALEKFDERAFVDFLQDIDDRSGWGDGGRWELIGGIPVDLPPATIGHSIIAQNLERMLANALGCNRPDLDVLREVGVRHPLDEYFRPVADVVVYEVAELNGRDQDRFFETCQLVCEVLSPSTRHHDLVFKRRRYIELPGCQHILFLEQNEMRARHWSRASGWAETVYSAPSDRIALPEFSFSCHLKDLYARTDLA